MSTLIKLRRDSAANWAAADPILALGEPGYDTTNNELRIGDGTSAWSELTPIAAGAANTGNVTFDNYNLYNVNGGQIVISNLSYVDEVETAYIQIPAGNSASDLSITQEQGNVAINANGNIWHFGGDVPEAIYWPDGSFQATAFVGSAITAEGLANVGNANITVGNVGNTYTWTFDTDGHINIPNNSGLFSSGQIQSANGYPTLLAYGSGGHGGPELDYCDSDDPNNIVDNPDVYRNVLYINAEGLYVGMNENGNANVAGGASNSWLFDPTGNLTLPGNTFAVNYANGTPVSISGGGNTGNVTFDDVTIQGDNSVLNLSTGPDFSANLQFFRVRAGDVPSHIHFDSGDNSVYDLFIGDDSKFLQVSNSGNIILQANDSVAKTFTFDTTGNLILPDNSVIREGTATNPGGSIGSVEIVPGSQFDPTQRLVVYPTALEGNHLHLTSGNIAVTDIMLGDDSQFIKTNTAGGMTIGANTYWSGTEFIGETWTFDNAGNLTIPGNGAIQTPSGSNANIVIHPDGTGLVNIIGGAGVLLLLESDSPGTLNRIEIDTIGNNDDLGGTFTGRHSRINNGLPAAVLNGDRLVSIKGKGFDGTDFSLPTGQITVDAQGNWSSSNHGTHVSIWTTPENTITMQEVIRVQSYGDYTQLIGNIVVSNGVVKTNTFTVSSLPLPANAGIGSRSFVTDADTRTWGNIAVGGAGNAVPVWSDGSNWYVG